MLGQLLSTAGRQSLRGSVKKIAADKLMGRRGKKNDRRQNVKNVMQQQGEYEGGGALAIRPSASLIPTDVSDSSLAISESPASKGGGVEGALVRISVKTIAIDNFLKTKKENDKRQDKSKRIQEENRRRQSREGQLEKKKDNDAKPTGFRVPLPQLGFFGKIKKFITNVLLGWIVIRLLKWLPQLTGILSAVGKAVDTFITVGGWLFNAVATVVKIGYDAFTAVENQVKNIFGDEGLKVFHQFTDAFKLFLTTSVIAAMVAARSGVLGQSTPGRNLGGLSRGLRPGQLGGNKAIRRYIRKYGVDAARRRFGTQAVRGLGGKFARSGFTNLIRKGTVSVLGKGGTRIGLKFIQKWISPLINKIPIIGALIDFALQVFVFKESPGRAAFKAIGAGIGAWLGGLLAGVLGSIIPVAGTAAGALLGAFLGGIGGDWLGGVMYDVFFAGKKGGQTSKPPSMSASDEAGAGYTGGRNMWQRFFDPLQVFSKDKPSEGAFLGKFIHRDMTLNLHQGEMVIDKTGTEPLRPMLMAINAASTPQEAIQAVEDYASYEVGSPNSPLVVPVSPPMIPLLSRNESGSLVSSSSGGGSDFTEILYKG